jgi:death-on-curing protein
VFHSAVRYLDLADFLLIAEAVLGVDARELAYAARLNLAESALAAPSATLEGHEFYPTFPEKAAVLCSRLIRNHPLPDGNKRVGYLCLIELVERNGRLWSPHTLERPSLHADLAGFDHCRSHHGQPRTII